MKHGTSSSIAIILVCILTLVSFTIYTQEVALAAGGTEVQSAVPAPTGVKATKVNSVSLKVTWKKVAGASGYAVYKWDAKAKKYKGVRTLTGVGKIAWTDGKLKSNLTYKYKVRAFKNVSGKKQYGAFSETVSARAYTAKSRTVNVKSIQVDYVARYLGLNGVKKVTASVVVPKGKTALSKKLIWKSSNRSIVKVNQHGWIEAQGKPGKAKVVVRAHNGITKILSITVADYAHPSRFSNLSRVRTWNKTASEILSKYRNEMMAVVAFLERYKKRTHFFYRNGDLQVLYDYIDCDPVRESMIALVKNTKMTVEIEKGVVFFTVPVESAAGFGASIVFSDDNNNRDRSREGVIKVAPCWYFVDGRNDLD